MAQRKFRVDDTDPWLYRYGNGSAGAGTISSDTTDDATRTPKTTLSLSSASTAATFGSFTGFSDGDLVLCYQSRDGGAGAGEYELNKIASHSGANVTLAHNSVQAYGTTAQVIKLTQFSSFTVNSAKTLTAQAWDGSVGGLLPILCNGTVTITGNLSANSAGYRGTSHAAGKPGFKGEGTLGAGGTQNNSTNGNGGGGGGNNGGTTNGGGGGGGNANSGSAGTGGTGGVGGLSAGNAALTTFVFGGGGATGGDGTTIGAGGNGAGAILIIAKRVVFTGGCTLTGANGASGSGGAGGGAGAGGSLLIKCQTASLGSSIITASGGSGGGGSTGTGGDGSVGRIHVDYSDSVSGTTSPAADTRQDNLLIDPGGMFIFNLI